MWFTKVKYVKSSSFSSSPESPSSLFYRLTCKLLIQSDLQILDMIFEESCLLSRKLEMPFRRLHLYSASRLGTVASTDCGGGISYNAFYLFEDAESIRQTLVHELCHSVVSGHGRTFSKVLEDSLLSLGFISRPCAYSDKLYDPYDFGARFPYGKYCPGYDFYDRSNLFPLIVSVTRNPKLNPMRGISLWKNV